MMDDFIKLINHYDLLNDQMGKLVDEALAFHSTNPMAVTAEIAALMEKKLTDALITLKIP